MPGPPGPAPAGPRDGRAPDLGRHAGHYERVSRQFDVSVRDGQLRMVLTMTGHLAALTASEPEDLLLHPADASGTRFVMRSRDDEPWVPLSFGQLGDGTPTDRTTEVGAMARGDAHEGMNFAGVRKLPVVFICDNNQWAYSTPTHLEYAVEHLADRAQSYGFDGVVVAAHADQALRLLEDPSDDERRLLGAANWAFTEFFGRLGRIDDQGRIDRIGRPARDSGNPPHHLDRVLQHIRRADGPGELDNGAARQALERCGHRVQRSAPADSKHVAFDDDLGQQSRGDFTQVLSKESGGLVRGDDDDGMVQAKGPAQAIGQIRLDRGRHRRPNECERWVLDRKRCLPARRDPVRESAADHLPVAGRQDHRDGFRPGRQRPGGRARGTDRCSIVAEPFGNRNSELTVAPISNS